MIRVFEYASHRSKYWDEKYLWLILWCHLRFCQLLNVHWKCIENRTPFQTHHSRHIVIWSQIFQREIVAHSVRKLGSGYIRPLGQLSRLTGLCLIKNACRQKCCLSRGVSPLNAVSDSVLLIIHISDSNWPLCRSGEIGFRARIVSQASIWLCTARKKQGRSASCLGNEKPERHRNSLPCEQRTPENSWERCEIR